MNFVKVVAIHGHPKWTANSHIGSLFPVSYWHWWKYLQNYGAIPPGIDDVWKNRIDHRHTEGRTPVYMQAKCRETRPQTDGWTETSLRFRNYQKWARHGGVGCKPVAVLLIPSLLLTSDVSRSSSPPKMHAEGLWNLAHMYHARWRTNLKWSSACRTKCERILEMSRLHHDSTNPREGDNEERGLTHNVCGGLWMIGKISWGYENHRFPKILRAPGCIWCMPV